MSHEYHMLATTGEDKVFHCEKCGLAKNKETVGKHTQSVNYCTIYIYTHVWKYPPNRQPWVVKFYSVNTALYNEPLNLDETEH